MAHEKSLFNFFRYYTIGVIICAIRVNVEYENFPKMLWELFITFIYCNVIGIWGGLAAMFGQDLYFYLKTKIKK